MGFFSISYTITAICQLTAYRPVARPNFQVKQTEFLGGIKSFENNFYKQIL